ncbi:MAG: ABC transporter ATP-binding protein/permease [Desulfarculus sp.]|nr:ABC transporter ATP-binding protein/permease [Desulfarculus sp.]
MPPFEFGYMEGDQLGRPYDLRLLRRLMGYARPHLPQILLASLLILGSTGLDILLPYLTRSGIDHYILPEARLVHSQSAPPDLLAALRTQGGDTLVANGQGGIYVPGPVWRGLDPRLAARLRQSGALDPATWYLAPAEGPAAELAHAHPELFHPAQGRWLIASGDLDRLDPAQRRALRGPDLRGLAGLALLYVLIAAGAYLLGFGQQLSLERTGQRMMLSIRQKLFEHLVGRSLAFHSRNPVGKLVTRLTNDVQNLNELFTSSLVAFFQDIFLLVGITGALLWLDWRLALVCLALTPMVAAVAWLFSRLARDAFRDLQGQLGRINARLAETLAGLAVIQLLRAQAQGAAEFARLNQAYYRAGMRQIWVMAVFLPLTELLSSLAVALILWYGGGQVVQERLSLGTLVAFIAYMHMFFRPVRDLAEKYNILQAAMASAERIFHLMDDDRALPAPARPRPPADGPGEVRFENVTFGYDPERPVLRGVDFTIPAGQSWAVVGPTGAGKTSLAGLLLRLHDPQQGRVLLDGVDLRELDPAGLARRVALVDQEVFLFSGDLRDNLTLGRDWVTPSGLEAALAVSGADAVARQLPEGLDTPLGEGGRRLSAGQRQLLSLARALAGQPAVLVLDEATSSVDPQSERLIQEALPRIMAGRTALVIAHRLSTIRHADHILVMQKGRIVEQGRHEDLMAQDGVYARLVRLQRLRAAAEGAAPGADDEVGAQR